MDKEPILEKIVVSNKHPDYVSIMSDEENFEKRKAPLEVKFKEVILPYIENSPQLEHENGEDKLRYVFCGSAVNLLTALSSEEQEATISETGQIVSIESKPLKSEVKKLLTNYASMPGDVDVIPISAEASELQGDNENELWNGERIVSFKINDKEFYVVHPVDNWITIILFRLQHGMKTGHEQEKFVKLDLSLRALVQQYPLQELTDRTIEHIDHLPQLDKEIIVGHLTNGLEATQRFLGLSEETDAPALELFMQKLSASLQANKDKISDHEKIEQLRKGLAVE